MDGRKPEPPAAGDGDCTPPPSGGPRRFRMSDGVVHDDLTGTVVPQDQHRAADRPLVEEFAQYDGKKVVTIAVHAGPDGFLWRYRAR